MSHTFVIMELSQAAYDEIKAKMLAVGYTHAIWDEGEHGTIIDMHGIALAIEDKPTPKPEPAFDATGRSEHCSACSTQLVADAKGVYCPECTPR